MSDGEVPALRPRPQRIGRPGGREGSAGPRSAGWAGPGSGWAGPRGAAAAAGTATPRLAAARDGCGMFCLKGEGAAPGKKAAAAASGWIFSAGGKRGF